MLYRFLKIMARPGLRLVCRNIRINRPEMLKEKGPLLLAANHPNSFLDSVIIDTIFEEPVWSLARGDAFKKPWIGRLLYKLNILPVYRTSEGVENLSENYRTFEDCINIFRNNGIVTIYSEGRCINEWHLRPLKKGTARLATKAWEQGIPLRVLPVGINYSSFTKFGKNIFLNFGDMISSDAVNRNEADGLKHAAFNQKLESELRKLVFEIPAADKSLQKEKLMLPVSPLKKLLLAVPAFAGLILHAPVFLPLKNFVWKRTRDNDHYDSIMAGALLLSYPLYLLFITGIAALFFPSWWLLAVFIIAPFCAWSYIQLKRQID